MEAHEKQIERLHNDLQRVQTAHRAMGLVIDALLVELGPKPEPAPRKRRNLKQGRMDEMEINMLMGKWSKPLALRKTPRQ